MELVETKVIDNKLLIRVSEKLSNTEFLNNLKNKISNLLFINGESRKEIIIDILSRNLNNKEILEMFDIFDEDNRYIITKIVSRKKLKEEICVIKGSIRAGEIKIFNRSILLIGSINRGSKIIVDGNLYVLGRIQGDVEIKDKANKIYCEHIYNSLVKIGNIYQIYTSDLEDQIIYVKDSKIINSNYKMGDKENVKSNSSYIW